MSGDPPRDLPSTSRSVGHASRWGTVLALLLLAACGTVMILSARPREPAALPLGGRVGEFDLVNQDGKPFGRRDLAGKVWVASFIFTNCRDTCPCITTHLGLVQEAMRGDPALVAGARLISFSVDPERDGPAALKAFARRYGADESVWTFLTGERGEVVRLSQEAFRLPVGQAPLREGAGAAPEIVHSDRLALVDADGLVQGFYRPEAEEVKRLVADLRRLVSRGGR